MAVPSKPRILCVDDEPSVLEGLKLTLGRRYEIATAAGGAQGLELLQAGGPYEVVLSDMSMPGMNGADFLSQVNLLAPNTVRILLTGHADIESAIRAVNDGQIYRFLTKPCPPLRLGQVMESAIQQYRLLTAEKELLEQTLLGSVKVLAEVLALAQPEAFGRAIRIKQYACEIADAARVGRRWEVETAAILSQLGAVTLPSETLMKARTGQPLNSDEKKALAKVPELSEQLLAHIPRLEGVREILHIASRPHDAGAAPSCAEMLRLATEFDQFEARGMTAVQAIEALMATPKSFDATLLGLFGTARLQGGTQEQIRQMLFAGLRAGMTLAEDIYTAEGVLFAAHGYVVTDAFVERLRNSKAGLAASEVRVVLPSHPDARAA